MAPLRVGVGVEGEGGRGAGSVAPALHGFGCPEVGLGVDGVDTRAFYPGTVESREERNRGLSTTRRRDRETDGDNHAKPDPLSVPAGPMVLVGLAILQGS